MARLLANSEAQLQQDEARRQHDEARDAELIEKARMVEEEEKKVTVPSREEAVEELQGNSELSDIEPETIMDISVPSQVQQEEREEHTSKFIIDFSCSDEEIDAQLAAYMRWKGEMCIKTPMQGKNYDSTSNYYNSHESDLPLSCEDDVVQVSHFEPMYEQDADHTHEPETIMDVEVPLPIQQVANSSHWCPTPWNIDDDFWSDDEEVVEEAELEMADYTVPMEKDAQLPDSMNDYEDGCYPTNPIWDVSDASEKGDDHTPSWEEEFGDELVDLPIPEEEKEFDPVGDLVYLEKLLAGKPTVVIENAPNRDEKVEEEVDSWPVEEVDVGLKIQQRKREKARKKVPGYQDRSPHYMLRIRFGPGIYKFWLSDLFKLHKTFSGFIIGFIINNDEQINYNGLDRVQIKEKPPD